MSESLLDQVPFEARWMHDCSSCSQGSHNRLVRIYAKRPDSCSADQLTSHKALIPQEYTSTAQQCWSAILTIQP